MLPLGDDKKHRCKYVKYCDVVYLVDSAYAIGNLKHYMESYVKRNAHGI